MGMNDFSIGLIAGLDGTKSKQQLNQDIEALKRQLGSVEIQAKLDSNTITNLTKQLNSVQINLQNVFIDQTAINNMVSQINTALSGININLGNALNNNVGQAAQNVGRQAGNIISGEVENSLRNVTSKEIGLSFKVDETDSDEFNNAVDKEIRKLQQAKNKMVSVNYTTDTKQSVNELTGEYEHVEKLTGAVFRYNTETGEAITKTMKWAQIGTTVDDKGNDVPLMGWVQGLTRYSKALDESKVKVDNFAKIQKTATANLNNQINQLNASALDKNADRPITESGHLTQLESKYNEVKNAITTMGNASRDTFTDEQINVKELISQYKILVSEFRNAENVRSTFKSDKLTEGISKAQSQFKALQAEISSSGVMASDKLTNEVSNITKLFGSDNGASMTKAQVEQVFTSLSNAKNELNALVKMNVSESSIKILSTQANTLLEQINNFEKNNPQFSNFSKTIDGVDVSVDKLKNDLQTVNSAADLRLIKSQFANLQTSFKSTSVTANGLATDISRLSKAESWQKWLDNNTKSTKKYGKEIKELIDKMKNLDEQMTKSESNDLTAKMKGIQISARNSGLLGNTTIDKLKTAWQKFGGWSIATGSLMTGVNKVKEAVSKMKDMDDILTEISKTSDLTTEQIKKLGVASYDTASKYGKKSTDYLTGVQEMYRAGFDNAEEMSELSILAQSAGDMTSDAANDYLIATNAAYDYKNSVEELNKVLDSQNYITNNAAISMQDMADATSESASVAAQYGVKVDELSALIATVVSKTRESGSEAGTALKSLFITLQDTTSKPVRKAFEAVGISMTKMVDGAERLKTPIELLKELSVAFNSLPEGDTKRANILTDIGKKYHANDLAAILSDWESYEKMLNLYNSNSANGSALEEAEKSANNLTGSLNKLSNTWTEFINHLVQSDDIKNIVNLGNDALSLIDDITSHIGLLGVAITGSGIFSVTKFIKNFDWVLKPYTKNSLQQFLVGQS